MIRTQLWASGGGVQSAAIAALIAMGEIKPDLAAIVDTGREQSTTWSYMDAIIVPALSAVGVTLHRIYKNQFEGRDLYGGADNNTLLLPAFSTRGGEVGKLSNWCSSYWKREVIKRWANRNGVDLVDTWLGISVDEIGRMQKHRGQKWHTRYPLIERGMNRGDCITLVRRMGWPDPPRSSCYMCPNHTAQEWRDIRDNKPADWHAAIEFERDLHRRDPHAFLHHDCVPLDQADLDERNGVLFAHCDSGMCFV